MTASAAALLLLTALPFPAPKMVAASDKMKCDWGSVTSVKPDSSELVIATAAGPVTFQSSSAVPVVGLDGKPAAGLSELKPGQRVRVYYTVENGTKLSEVDLIE
jgi:hypothetical protein